MEAIEVVDDRDIGHVDYVEPRTIEAPPREEPIAGTDRQPAKRSESEAESAPESEEGDVGRRPQRTVKRRPVRRSRPPYPSAVVLEPTSVVIRGPAPGLIRNPGPSPTRLPNPPTVAIGRPVGIHVRRPHRAVVRDRSPVAVGIQIFAANVVAVGMAPTVGILNEIVAIAVPAVPVVAGGRIGDFVRGVTAGPADDNPLSGADPSPPLRRGNLGLAPAHHNVRFAVGNNQDSIASVPSAGVDRGIRGVEFDGGFAVPQNGISREALAQLDLNVFLGECPEIGLAVLGKPQNIGVVELHLGARLVAGGNLVASHHGRIQRGSRPVSGVATLGGDLAFNQTDAGSAGVSFSRSRRAGTLVVGTLVVGTLIVGTLVVGTLVVGTLAARGLIRILSRHLVVRYLSAQGARN